MRVGSARGGSGGRPVPGRSGYRFPANSSVWFPRGQVPVVSPAELIWGGQGEKLGWSTLCSSRTRPPEAAAGSGPPTLSQFLAAVRVWTGLPWAQECHSRGRALRPLQWGPGEGQAAGGGSGYGPYPGSASGRPAVPAAAAAGPASSPGRETSAGSDRWAAAGAQRREGRAERLRRKGARAHAPSPRPAPTPR